MSRPVPTALRATGTALAALTLTALLAGPAAADALPFGIDRNGDGVVDLLEAKDFRARVVRTMDLDGNGQVTRAEAIESSGGLDKVNPEKTDTSADFKAMDADNDEIVTLEEAQALAEKRFGKLDKNHDGKVGPDEYKLPGF
ncbi:hypothetical protein [Oceanibacterium hippocampi]|uniref:EF hand n=1 Tax=Oceanibacterium hippocampi TaxID=745714 RepID=A0A1Y5S9B1_9PROT|nr:hypothetical protein [Oceanibacterium hippocampi]SLN33963.1 EF hand [Oceanibacterium hippocampi]